jgi:hypothetical protein
LQRSLDHWKKGEASPDAFSILPKIKVTQKIQHLQTTIPVSRRTGEQVTLCPEQALEELQSMQNILETSSSIMERNLSELAR